jgi:hypothetical protein
MCGFWRVFPITLGDNVGDIGVDANRVKPGPAHVSRSWGKDWADYIGIVGDNVLWTDPGDGSYMNFL